jgi:hypothetical protein
VQEPLDCGRVRFIEPLECPTKEIIHLRTTTELAIRPPACSRVTTATLSLRGSQAPG